MAELHPPCEEGSTLPKVTSLVEEEGYSNPVTGFFLNNQ